MKREAIAIVFLLAATLVCASVDPQVTIRKAVERASEAVIAGDTDAILDSTYPKLIEQVGGRESMREILTKNLTGLEQRGLTVVSNEIVSISEPVRAGTELHAIVRSRRTLKAPRGRQIHDTFLIAVSGDDGQSWSFVDGPQLTPNHIKILFPDFNSALVLPRVDAPVFQADP